MLENYLTTVDTAFQSIAANFPDRTAIAHNEFKITYGELNSQSERLAAWLADLLPASDTTRPSLVAFCVSPGAARVAIMLGVLRAGGAFVPINPEFPDQRIRYILDDIGAGFVIADEANAERLSKAVASADRSIEIVRLPDATALPAGSVNESSPNGPDTLAYVMYTSGTTGRPKGVLIPHRGICRLVIDTNYIAL